MYSKYYIYGIKIKWDINYKLSTPIKEENTSLLILTNIWKLMVFNINLPQHILLVKMALQNKKTTLFSMPLDVCLMKLNYQNHIGAKLSHLLHTLKIVVLPKKFQMTKLPLNYGAKENQILLTFASLEANVLQRFKILFELNLTIKLLNIYCLVVAPLVKDIRFKESQMECFLFQEMCFRRSPSLILLLPHTS